MPNKRQGSVLKASARPAHVSVVNSENCAFALGDMVQYQDFVHRAPARPAHVSVEKAENCTCAIRDMGPCSTLQPDLRMCQ
jgi:hypothetical protein